VSDGDVAVVGMAARFPGAPDLAAFWRLLQDGVDAVSALSEDELRRRGVPDEELQHPAYVRAAAALDGIDRFAAAFFDVPADQAAILNPQQRLLLECAWEGLEDAGHPPGAVGVYASGGSNRYCEDLLADPAVASSFSELDLLCANDREFLAPFLSYKLDFRGPSMNVQSACSSSLLAVGLACQGLLTGECDVAVAGGVQVHLPHRVGYRYREGGIHSRDGRTRPFDAAADGTISSSGVGVVVLKRLEDALAGGDRVRAVIKGHAVTNDGGGRMAFATPSASGEAAAIREAYVVAEVDPASVGYVETHGSATPLGDAIEIAALRRTFRDRGAEPACALGAVKANIGNADAAGGVASLIKCVLMLEHRSLVPLVHLREPNPRLEMDGGPFRLETPAGPWPAPAGVPRRAGVSSFGIGGTNIHVVLEEAPPPEPPQPPAAGPVLLVWSARSEPELRQVGEALRQRLEREPAPALTDLAFSLRERRRAFPCRRAALVSSIADARAALSDRRQGPPAGTLLPSLAARWLAGEDVAWSALPRGRYVPLPAYPLAHTAHWAGRSAP
jgi:acyl transferase domain-containing protein